MAASIDVYRAAADPRSGRIMADLGVKKEVQERILAMGGLRCRTVGGTDFFIYTVKKAMLARVVMECGTGEVVRFEDGNNHNYKPGNLKKIKAPARLYEAGYKVRDGVFQVWRTVAHHSRYFGSFPTEDDAIQCMIEMDLHGLAPRATKEPKQWRQLNLGFLASEWTAIDAALKDREISVPEYCRVYLKKLI